MNPADIVSKPATGGLYCDTDQKLTASNAVSLRASGYLGLARYVPLPGNNPAKDIDAEELEAILSAGLELWLVQHVRATPAGKLDGWDPRNHSGSLDAAEAAAHALTAGYPEGAHIFCDWEGVIASCDVQSAVMFLESWSGRMLQSPYKAGLYVGFQQPLSAIQLYDLKGFNSYWTDAGHRIVAVRGCAIEQGRGLTVDGVKVDNDTIAPDRLGDVPFGAAINDSPAMQG